MEVDRYMGKKTFLKGAAILGIAGLITQILGAVFRIPLGNIVGDEGMGYYQTVYPIYIFLLVFSTNGAPAAISKMTSEKIAQEDYSGARRIFKLSFIVMFVIGVIAYLIFTLGAKPIVYMLSGQYGAYYAMLAIAPALVLVPLMSVFRGYFQGMQDMAPTAVSQLTEQTVRVALGLTLAIVFLKKGINFAAAGATLGTSIGPVAGLLILVFIYKKRKNMLLELEEKEKNFQKEPAKNIFKTLIYIAVPITIGVSILPIMNIADVTIVMQRMQDAGFSTMEANALYGQLTGLAGPIINIPMALGLSIALSMVPAIASAHMTKDVEFLKENTKLGLRTAMIVGVPCALGLMAISRPVMQLLYPLQRESAVNAAPCLFILSIGIIFLSVAQAMAGVLQGISKPSRAVMALGIGFVVKCMATYILVGFPELNVKGAAIGTASGYAACGICNYYFVKKYTETKFDIQLAVIKPMISGTVMFVSVFISEKLLEYIVGISIATVISIAIGAIVFFVMIIKTKAVTVDELRNLPKGEKLVKVMYKIKLVKE